MTYYLISQERSPYYNQALEERLFHLDLEEDILLIWQNRPTLVFGCYQNPFYEINIPYAWAEKLPIIRRISGGGTVYHDEGNVNYTVITTVDPEELDFLRILKPLEEALHRMGYPVEIRNRCDIYLGDAKISGNAQKLSRNRLLHHGTLLFDSDLNRLRISSSKKQEKMISKGIKSRPAHVGNLKEAGGEAETVEEFIDGLRREWLPRGAKILDLSPEFLNSVEVLAKEKYQSWDWTFGASPEHRFQGTWIQSGKKISLSYRAGKGRIQVAELYVGGRRRLDWERAIIGLAMDEQSMANFCRISFGEDFLDEII